MMLERFVGATALLFAMLPIACGGEIADGLEPEAESAVEPGTEHETRGLAGTVGVFLFHRQTEEGLVYETALTASFEAQGGSGATCTEVQDGACVRKICRWNHGQGGVPELATAGRITATSDGRALSVTPEERGNYSANFEPIELWNYGRPIVIEAEGGAIPAFRAEVLGPEHTMIVEPKPVQDTTLLVDRSAPLLATWQESEVGEMLAILKYRDDFEQGSITCRFPAQEEGGVLSRGLIQDFNPNNVQMRLTMGIGHSAVVDAGGWDVEVIAYTSATTPVDDDASFPVLFR